MKKKRSTVWRHFKEEPGNKVSCRTCHKILTNHGNTSIMLRHLRGKHPELVGCLLELDGPTVTGEVTWPVDNQPQQVVVDETEAVVDNTSGGNKKRSTVWRHFQEEGNDKVSCRICREKLAKHGNTSSMLRHLRGKHPQLKLPLFQSESNRKSSRFHLKTNITESRFMSICDRLLRNNQLTDCTLVAEGQFVQAHRLVLASCSESFEEIFRNVTQMNPVIVLRDISIQELRGLINYMYKGETLVKSNELHGLLKAAAQLKIKEKEESYNTPFTERKFDFTLATCNDTAPKPNGIPCAMIKHLPVNTKYLCKDFPGIKKNMTNLKARSLFMEHVAEHREPTFIYTDSCKPEAGV
ncbi:uncharacterized protein [Palaemon carinicauda]|uniref:uncharacterized protein n=1 Tax=Palaemon carinicauda TaxID=392227 RepID=UPI0035B5DF67